MVLVTRTHLYVANAGDSRCVVSERGKAIELSTDHKPDVRSEHQRISAAGHSVEEGRVDGTIAISRAIGDWDYKDISLNPKLMAVSSYPDVKVHPISMDTEFFICACDGIWDCYSSQKAVDFVAKAQEKQRRYTPGSSPATPLTPLTPQTPIKSPTKTRRSFAKSPTRKSLLKA